MLISSTEQGSDTMLAACTLERGSGTRRPNGTETATRPAAAAPGSRNSHPRGRMAAPHIPR
jgi:hypothetical protein